MFAVLLVSGLGAAEFGSATVAEVRTIYDGDTFRVNIAGWPSVVGESMPVRIKGVDTPELRGKCQSEKDAARAAKQFSVGRLREGRVIELRFIERDKYFRLLAEVWIDGMSLGDQLISQGFAVPYTGGKKIVWC
ncbi:thermonuclease family protein [uncultured Zhongshania sp.]|uniref:thermonuclease family protein n=1 Tax=uncultured Zhongshania sp. TaxID=1642288 RepID=UPI0030DA2409